MDAIGIITKVFGTICILISFVVGGVAFAAANENEEYFSACILGVITLLLFGAGLHFFGQF